MDQHPDDYYRKAYRNYRAQNPPGKLAFYRTLIGTRMRPDRPMSIHDLGCAYGLFLASLTEEWTLSGSDISPQALNVARTSLPEGHFTLAERLNEIPDASFGFVTAWDVIEHIHDLNGVADLVSRILVSNGIFAMVVPVYGGPFGPIVRLLDKDDTHVHKRARHYWINWAGQHFKLLEWMGVFRYLLPGNRYIHWPTRNLRCLAPAIALVCEKR